MYHSLDEPWVHCPGDVALRIRAAEYLKGAPICEWPFKFQRSGEARLENAGDEETRPSTSCCHLYVGVHLVDCKQQLIAPSSDEAEIYALGHGSAEGIFLWQVAVALGFARVSCSRTQHVASADERAVDVSTMFAYASCGSRRQSQSGEWW